MSGQVTRVCRFSDPDRRQTRIGLAAGDGHLLDLTPAGITDLGVLLEGPPAPDAIAGLDLATLPRLALDGVLLRPPVEKQEIWAAGVTYLRSKTARMEESDFSATAYDRVYDAARPEIFFKGLADKAVATGEAVGIRRDARWSVPEPELALVANSRGEIRGFTIGNDMSSRDIEGENLLYLPQAKVYDRSCALGPWIVLGSGESQARGWRIGIRIARGGREVFAAETSVGQIRRGFGELVEYLFRSQTFPHGAVLLTGTGLVPPDTFTLQEDDLIEIEIPPIGMLRNRVVVV